jgi:hypothetical protein
MRVTAAMHVTYWRTPDAARGRHGLCFVQNQPLTENEPAMIGHTNKATINKRRPLTENMKWYLDRLANEGRAGSSSLTQSGANAMRALCDRGYATWLIEFRAYEITDAGRAALEQ